MTDDASQDGSGVPDGWAPDGLLAGVPDMNAAAGQSTLPVVMSPQQIAQVDWGGSAPAGGDVPPSAAGPPYITASEGGDADTLTREINSLDPQLSQMLGPLHWVAVPNSVDQDDKGNLDPDTIPRGWPVTGDDGQLTYGDLDGIYDTQAAQPHVIIATDGGNAGDGSYNTVFHETAHGIDGPDALQSKGADFQKAYNADTPLMTPGEDDYYRNKDSGPSESYAESFARYFGGDPTLQQDWPNMYDYWVGQYPDVRSGQPWKWSEQ